MLTLTGPWWIARDPRNVGRDERWFDRGPGPDAVASSVPGLIQQPFPGYHGLAWYWTTFRLPEVPDPHQRCLVRFAAVDYMAQVWINGSYIGSHEGGETPFELDATDAVRRLPATADHRLAVCVLNPLDEPVDGIVLNETPHRNKRVDYRIGWSFNRGGIVAPVTVVVLPAIRVTDLFAQPDPATGDLDLKIAVRNDMVAAPACGALAVTVEPAGGGDPIATAMLEVLCGQGTTTTAVACRVPSPHLWSTDDPYLYRVAVTLAAQVDPPLRHTYSVRCGFRHLRVENGYFRLNGRRIFFRCSHTGNDWPSAMTPAQVAAAFRRDILNAKAAGFNAIRFIAGLATSAQLDLCDELGLMVYEEAYSSWCMEYSPHFGARFNAANEEMIRRDRNHPSVVIWGLLNETMDGPVFRHAVGMLPLIRSLDPTRLVLLNTGRMDCELGIGSVSNPGSVAWEHQWGAEAPGALRYENLKEPHTFGGYPGGYFEHVGDAHMYPPTPHSPETIRFLRDLGHDTKPVYIGEYGIASAVNAIRVTRLFEQAGKSADLFEDGAYYHAWAAAYERDWQRYGMDEVAPFPEDMLHQSQVLHAAQRLNSLNAIRANPHICGYNLTGTVDQGMTAEGLWTTWREFKPCVLDALADGLAPLRWCLFVEPRHVYRGRPVRLEAVLANEDILPPGIYPATARVFGPGGIVWERSLDLTVATPAPGSDPPLAIPVLAVEVIADGRPGPYQFALQIERGAAPAGGRATFYVGEDTRLALPVPVTVWEDDGRLAEWLARRGAAYQAFEPSASVAQAGHAREVILVGNLPASGGASAAWQGLWRRVSAGAWVIVLDPATYDQGADPLHWLPLAKRGRCDIFYNSIYHREDVAKRHPIFDGLPSGGIMDWEYYRDIIPLRLFQDQDPPDETIVAGFAIGYTCPTGYTSGVALGAYRLGAGCFLVNTLRLREHLGTHPVADRLLANMIRWAASGS